MLSSDQQDPLGKCSIPVPEASSESIVGQGAGAVRHTSRVRITAQDAPLPGASGIQDLAQELSLDRVELMLGKT